MEAIPFKKPSAKALLQSLPEADRKAFVADILTEAVEFEKDKDAVGYVFLTLYRSGTRTLRWNTVRGSVTALEGALRRSGQEIIKFLRERGD